MSLEYSEHILIYRPPLSYIDPGQVVYNGRYLDIYNYVRDEYMRDIGYTYLKLNSENHMHLAVVEANLKFRMPLLYDEKTEIFTRVEKIGIKSINFSHKIYKDDRKVLCNEAKFTLVCIGASFKSEPLPEEFKQAIKRGPLK